MSRWSIYYHTSSCHNILTMFWRRSGGHSTWRCSTPSPRVTPASGVSRYPTTKSRRQDKRYFHKIFFGHIKIFYLMFSQLTFSTQVFDGWPGHGLGGRVPHRLQQMASRVPAAILSPASPTPHTTRVQYLAFVTAAACCMHRANIMVVTSQLCMKGYRGRF